MQAFTDAINDYKTYPKTISYGQRFDILKNKFIYELFWIGCSLQDEYIRFYHVKSRFIFYFAYLINLIVFTLTVFLKK